MSHDTFLSVLSPDHKKYNISMKTKVLDTDWYGVGMFWTQWKHLVSVPSVVNYIKLRQTRVDFLWISQLSLQDHCSPARPHK